MRSAINDLETSLNRIEALVNHIVANTGAALANSTIRELHETQQCGAVVLLTGYFEVFLKDMVKIFIVTLSASGVAFNSLPDQIRNRHYEGGGEVLKKASSSARGTGRALYGAATRENIATRLSSVSSSSGTPYEIVWEAFVDTDGNPGPEVVKAIATGVGLTDLWRLISNHRIPDPRWSGDTLKSTLSTLIAKRNECAHTGRVLPVPTATEIYDFIGMLRVLALVLVELMELHLQRLSPP